MKKVFSMLLVFTLLIALIPYQAFAQLNGQAKLYFELDESVETIEKGTIIPVHLKVSEATDLYGLQTSFTFDSDVLTLVSKQGAPAAKSELGSFFSKDIADVEVVKNEVTETDGVSTALLAVSYLAEPKKELKAEGTLATYYFIWESEDEGVVETLLGFTPGETKLINTDVVQIATVTEDLVLSLPHEIFGSVNFELTSSTVSEKTNERVLKVSLVNQQDPSIRFKKNISINSQGVFEGVPLGEYRLNVTNNFYKTANIEAITVSKENPTVSLGQISLEPVRSLATITGLVFDEDTAQPLKDVTVTISAVKGNDWFETKTTDSGSFTFNAIPYKENGSDYVLSFWKKGYAPKEQTITVNGNQDLSQNPVGLSDGAVLSGVVVMEGALTPSVQVSAYGDKGQYYYGNTNADGEFTLTSVTDGIYTLIISDPTGNYLYKTVENVEVTADKMLEGIVLDKAAQVQGQVVNSNGDPIRNAYLWLYNHEKFVYGSAITDANGSYTMKGLYVTEPIQAAIEAFQYGYVTARDEISLEIGQVATGVNFTLLRNGEVVSIFKGETNSFKTNKKVSSPGELLTYQLQYQHTGPESQTAENASIVITLPELDLINQQSMKVYQNGLEITAARDGKTITIPVGDITSNQKGNVTVMVNVANNLNAERSLVASAKMNFTLNGQSVSEAIGATSTGLLYTTFQAPSVTTNGDIVVFGQANPNTTVYIYETSGNDASATRLLGKAKTDGKYWSKNIKLTNNEEGVAQTHQLFVRAELDGKLSNPTAVRNVLYDGTLPQLEDITLNAGWNKDVKINPEVGIPTLAIVELSPIQIDLQFAAEGLDKMKSASVSFLGQTTQVTNVGQNMSVTIPGDWRGQGEESIYLNYTYQDGEEEKTVSLPIAQVIILIDPSGIVTDKATKQPISGIQATVEVWDNTLNQYVFWNAEMYGQVNPQLTDENGHYGWDVPEGKYRVVFESLDGKYHNLIADDNGTGILIPPPRTDVDVELTRTAKGKISEVLPVGQAVVKNSNVTITFDRWMNKDDFNASKFVMKSANDQVINGTFSFVKNSNAADAVYFANNDKAFNVLSFDPTVLLSSEETYTVSVGTDIVKDFYGLGLDAGKVWTFQVKKDTPAGGDNGGGVVTSPPTPKYEVINEELVVVVDKKVTKSPDGKDAAVISVDKDKFANSIKTLDKKYHTVLFKSEETVPVQQLTFSGEILAVLEGVKTVQNIKFETTLATYLIPIKALGLERLYKELNADSVKSITLTVSLEKLAAPKLNNPAVTSLTDAVDFKVLVTSGQKTVEIITFEGYVQRQFTVGSAFTADQATAVRFNADGSFNGVPTLFDGKIASIFTNASGQYTIVKHSKTFTDIKGTWNQATVEKLASKFVVFGISDSQFGPAQPVTRGQLTVLLTRSLGLQAKSAYNGRFKDVTGSEWYAKELMGAVESGIIGGFADQTFKANQVVTRQEAAAMISRALDHVGYQPKASSVNLNDKYKDSSNIGNWAKDSVQVVVNEGIIVGTTKDQFDPSAPTRRDQMVTILDRLLKLIRFSN